ncbi:MAG: DEAD/DEAH box helicase [Caldilineaceae bacterium]|nr:DEAD/DEAH box helicase [Caldilineaceae bacterium]
MTFEQFNLDTRLLAGIQASGYVNPTPIQQQAIPEVMTGRDVLGLAQTGTGKTAAFVLPILHRLTKGSLRRVRALIVAPTRELAEQIHETIVALGQKTKIRSIPIYGGVSKVPQIRALQRGVEIMVACPGRLLDLHSEGVVDLTQIEVLVLDEADRMFDMGFLPDVRRLIKLLPTQRQNLFFSATMPPDIRALADEILREPATVQIGMMAPAKTVSHALYPIPEGLKARLLLTMLDQMQTERVLIFTRTKRRARNLALTLADKKHRVVALQGNMSQPQRMAAMEGFRKGKYDILVATDIAARGIDVAEISHVINFDMPDTVDAYTHRIGRTGRAHATGEAFTFAMPDDAPMIRDIEAVLGTTIEQRRLDGFDYSGFTPEIRIQRGRPAAARSGQRPQNGQPSRRPQSNTNRSRPNAKRGDAPTLTPAMNVAGSQRPRRPVRRSSARPSQRPAATN